MEWLAEYREIAERTDMLQGEPEHLSLLVAGLVGEAGSIVSEVKKHHREGEAYPAYQRNTEEEIGDFLWYFVRLCDSLDVDLIEMQSGGAPILLLHGHQTKGSVALFTHLGISVGELTAKISASSSESAKKQLVEAFLTVWRVLSAIAASSDVDLRAAAEANIKKIRSRWPERRLYTEAFDEALSEEERLPRNLVFEFKEKTIGQRSTVVLKCNGINFGDRLTDNIADADGYRYHDIFHIAHVVHLGWSPVFRSLLRCKRKSEPALDENEDGARAAIIEEAVTALIFSHAKEVDFFRRRRSVEYGLLKDISRLVRGYEVEQVPLWQWETAILDGYGMFTVLLENKGGFITLDLPERKITWAPLAPSGHTP